MNNNSDIDNTQFYLLEGRGQGEAILYKMVRGSSNSLEKNQVILVNNEWVEGAGVIIIPKVVLKTNPPVLTKFKKISDEALWRRMFVEDGLVARRIQNNS